MKITERIQHAWNAFTGKETQAEAFKASFGATGGRPGHQKRSNFTTASFAASIFNRIAIDVATTTFEHVKLYENDEKKEQRDIIDSGLNYCLSTEANIDQSSKAFIQDMVYSMFDEGVVAVVPVETSISPLETGGYDIHSLRAGRIVEWFPKHVRVELYNENTGRHEEIFLDKKVVVIIENPLYAITNSENSVLKRLIRKMNELDDMDELVASGRLDLIIQLPYAMKTEAQVKNAKERLENIEKQLKVNHHGMAYIDGTEKVTQLNRPINDQLREGVEELRQEFYNQLGLTQTIFNGTASEAEVRLYYSRTIDPIIDYIIEEFNRKFLTKTARTQGHTIEAYRDMFKFVSIGALADMSDKFKRNAIMTTNEIRSTIRMAPHSDPRADELYNPNMPDQDQGIGVEPKIRGDEGEEPPPERDDEGNIVDEEVDEEEDDKL